MTTEKDPNLPAPSPSTPGQQVVEGVSTGLSFLGKVFAHPVTTLASRVASLFLSAPIPPLFGAVVAAQAISISFRTAQAYRKRSLVLREDLLKKLEQIDKEKQGLLKKLGVPSPDKVNKVAIQYEKSPRKNIKPSLLQSIGTTMMEEVVPIISDMISTHGVSLIPRVLKILNDTWMTVVSWFGGKKEGGTLTQRAQEIIENDARRDRIQKLATALDVPDYQRNPEILRKYIERQYRELQALKTIDAQGETYNPALFAMYTEQASSKKEPLLNNNAKLSLFKSSLREAVIGNKEDYAYITEAWSSTKNFFSNKPTPAAASPALSHTDPEVVKPSRDHEISPVTVDHILGLTSDAPERSPTPDPMPPTPIVMQSKMSEDPIEIVTQEAETITQPKRVTSKKMKQAEQRLLNELKKATVKGAKAPESRTRVRASKVIKASRITVGGG